MNLAKKLMMAGMFSVVVYTAANVYSYVLQMKISKESIILIDGFHKVIDFKNIAVSLNHLSSAQEMALNNAAKGKFNDAAEAIVTALQSSTDVMKSIEKLINESTGAEKDNYVKLYAEYKQFIEIINKIVPLIRTQNMEKVFAYDDQIDSLKGSIDTLLEALANSNLNATSDLDGNLSVAIEKTKSTQIIVLLTTLLVMVPLYYYLFSNIIRGLRKSVHNIGQLSDGNANIEIDGLEIEDETGELARSSVKLRNNLKQIQKLTGVLLDLPVGVMLVDADNHLKISYMNKFATDYLRKVDSSLKIKADAMVGSSLNDFIGDKTSGRVDFHDTKNLPYKMRAKFAEEYFDIQISPLYDSSGHLLSLMVTLVVVTKIENIATSFETSVSAVVSDLSNAVESLKQNAETVSEIAVQTTNKSATVSDAATKASHNMNSVASATEELSASVREISERLSHSNQISTRAVQEANSSNETINELSEKAERIGEVIDIIMAIAEQINLLALNATIESARAGEAGKGFAVVANEVKALANQTTKASEEISVQIKGVQDSTKKVVDSIASVAKVVNEINEISSSIATSVEEQSSATNEISANVQKTAGSTTEITTHINHVKTGAQETSASINQLRQFSNEINEKIISLKERAEDFLKTVRN